MLLTALLAPTCLMALCCAPLGDEEPAPAGLDFGPDGLTSLEPTLVLELRDEILEALDKGAGIRLPEPVTLVLITVDEARERRRAYTTALDDETGLSKAVDAMADLMFSEAMLGRYLPDEKVVYLFEDVIAAQGGTSRGSGQDFLFGVLAHELVHAYDDQVHHSVPDPREMADVFEHPERALEIQMHMALIEGRATWAAELASRHAKREPLRAPTIEAAQSASYFDGEDTPGGDFTAGIGNGMVRVKLAQYAYGRDFAKRAWEFGREPFFKEVFSHGPLTLAELEDFEAFKLRWAEEEAEAFDAAAAGEVEEPAPDAP